MRITCFLLPMPQHPSKHMSVCENIYIISDLLRVCTHVYTRVIKHVCQSTHTHTHTHTHTMAGKSSDNYELLKLFLYLLGEEVGSEDYTQIWHASWIYLYGELPIFYFVCGRSLRSMMLEYPTPHLLFPNVSTFHDPAQGSSLCEVMSHLCTCYYTYSSHGPGMVSE